MPMFKRACVVLLVIVASACGGSNSTTTPTPTPTPTPTIVSLTGTVSSTAGGRIAGATVKVLDGLNAGRSTATNSNGEYLLAGLTPSNGNVSANATIYPEVILGVFINGTNTLNFTFPVPVCQTNNTGSISFGNRSAGTTQDIVWDGTRLFTLTPGQTSNSITAAAGVAHTLQFKVANTQTLACTTGNPILSLCESGRTITCAGP